MALRLSEIWVGADFRFRRRQSSRGSGANRRGKPPRKDEQM